jgi:VanZ family protein
MQRLRTFFGFVFAAGVAAVVVLSLIPGKQVPSLGISDKIEHFAAYALLGLIGALAFPTRRSAALLIVLLPAMGLALEVAQTFVADRSTDLADAVANGIGAWLPLVPIVFLRLRPAKS